jgi:hypothetical protein
MPDILITPKRNGDLVPTFCHAVLNLNNGALSQISRHLATMPPECRARTVERRAPWAVRPRKSWHRPGADLSRQGLGVAGVGVYHGGSNHREALMATLGECRNELHARQDRLVETRACGRAPASAQRKKVSVNCATPSAS